MKKEIRELEKKRNEMYKKIQPITNKINKLRDEIAKKIKEKLLGKCFVYRNGCGDENWNLYSKVIDYDSYGVFMLECEKKPSGEIEISKSSCSGFGEHLQEKEISKELFNKKFNEMMEELNGTK